MNSKIRTRIIALTLFAALALPVQLSAQQKAPEHHQYHHYQLIDVGTFGGPNSSWPIPNPAGIVSNGGVAVGGADTSIPDPTSSQFNYDAYISYGFIWQDGVFQKLDALPGFNSSTALQISNNGHVVGVSENGIDPLTGSRALEALLWHKDGSFTDLGTLGGNSSVANGVNNRGEVVGAALNAIPDPYTGNFFIPGTTQSHAFRWTKSQGMQDLGTLGGADSAAFYINDRGQIAGFSFTDFTVNPNTGLPTLHPFLWEKGKMTDLGTLGGTFAGPFSTESFGGLNNRGDVIGASNLAGDLTTHPFLWTKSGGMQDLGTLGGTFGWAAWINDAREVIGLSSTVDDQALHAFLWRDGVMTDLGTPGSDAFTQANSINSRGQIVGTGTDSYLNDLNGFLWENGSIVDVNTLIAPGSGATILGAFDINDRGEIAGYGFDSNGDERAFLLIPCDEDHPAVEGCDYGLVDAATLQQNVAPATQHPAAGTLPSRMPAGMLNRFRSRWGQRTQVSGTVPAPAAEQTSAANTDGVDVEGGQLLGPLSRGYGFCTVRGGKLTGDCTKYYYYACAHKSSTACPSGQTAKRPGYYQCSAMFKSYVDLATACN